MIYSFTCPEHGGFDVFMRMKDARSFHRCHCGRMCQRDWSKMRPEMSTGMRDYVTADLTGEPVRVQTKEQERKLMESHGVVRVTDSDLPSAPRKKTVPTLPPLKEDLAKTKFEMKQSEFDAMAEGLRKEVYEKTKVSVG